jgi:hypothetical protein
MGQITVTRAAGGYVKLGTSHPPVNIISATQEMSLMDEDKVTISVECAAALNITIGDYITVYGRRYYINSPPVVTKEGARTFRYDFTFEGMQYKWADLQFKFTYNSAIVQSTEFPLTGSLSSQFSSMLNTLGAAFGLSSSMLVTNNVIKNLSFSSETCLEVINRLADEFEMEWYMGGTNAATLYWVLNAGTDRKATDIFSHNQGIRSIKRSIVTSKPFCTRLYVSGGNTNLPSNYRDYSQRLLPAGTLNYIENAAAKSNWGLIENSKIWEDIIPTRTGTITSLGANEKTFIDTGMDFDINGYLIAGTAAKVHFQTGKLAGYEYTIKSYSNATKTFLLNSITDERGLTTPNATNLEFKFAIGDTYKLIDILLPTSYITSAENTLLSTAETWLAGNCNPIVLYDLEMDERWISANKHGRADDNLYAVGDIIHINDTSLNINNDLRILGFKRDLLRPYKYDFTLGDAPYRKPLYNIINTMAASARILEIMGLDDPGSIRLRKWGERYSITIVSNA